MHCSSCLWLLENLHRLNPAVIASKVNFERKEADNKIEELHQLVWHVMGRTRAECSKHRIVQVLN